MYRYVKEYLQKLVNRDHCYNLEHASHRYIRAQKKYNFNKYTP